MHTVTFKHLNGIISTVLHDAHGTSHYKGDADRFDSIHAIGLVNGWKIDRKVSPYRYKATFTLVLAFASSLITKTAKLNPIQYSHSQNMNTTQHS
jgi:hypothetical protein